MSTSNVVFTFIFFVIDRKCGILFHSSENSSSPMSPPPVFVQSNGKLLSESCRRWCPKRPSPYCTARRFRKLTAKKDCHLCTVIDTKYSCV